MASLSSAGSLLEEELKQARIIISELQSELLYYRTLLLSDLNPTNSSILNSLRLSAEIKDENDRLLQSTQNQKLLKLCESVDEENRELKRLLASQNGGSNEGP